MRVSDYFREGRQAANRPAAIPAYLTQQPRRFPTLTHGARRPSSFRTGQVVPNTELTLELQSAPARCSSPPGHASPAGKTQRKTSPAKSCSPGNAPSRGFGQPASVWPASCKLLHAAQVQRAGCPWPPAPNGGTTSNQRPVSRTSRKSINKSSSILGQTSHKWDYSGFPVQPRTSTFLYQFPKASWPGNFNVFNRPHCAAGRY